MIILSALCMKGFKYKLKLQLVKIDIFRFSFINDLLRVSLLSGRLSTVNECLTRVKNLSLSAICAFNRQA